MPSKQKEPTALKPLWLASCIILLPVSITVMVIGIVGIQILLDSENKSSLSRTDFAQLYRRIIQTNPFFSAMFVNGGMIGTLFCATKLVEHRRATKAAAVRGAKQRKAENKEEAKKEK